jgi:peptide/nickel transport system permease protein
LATNFIFFVIRRSINAIITLLLLIALIFLIIHGILRTPLAFAKIYDPNPHATLGQLQTIVIRYHLNAPWYVQFWTYVVGIFHGNFGTDTINGNPELFNLVGPGYDYLQITLELVIIGQIVGVLIGLFTGAIAAGSRNKGADYIVKALYLGTWAAPPFLIGFALQLIFAYHPFFGGPALLPSSGLVNPFLAPPKPITGFPLIDSAIAGNWPYFWSVVQHLILPATTIAIIGFGVVTRLTRASMIDAMDRDYVKLAFMKGLTKRKVIYGTAFRNAIIPIITLVALIFAFSAAGAVVVEDVFNYHGMGFWTVQAITSLDYVAILTITFVIGIFVIVANFVADVMYAVADPRVRLE